MLNKQRDQETFLLFFAYNDTNITELTSDQWLLAERPVQLLKTAIEITKIMGQESRVFLFDTGSQDIIEITFQRDFGIHSHKYKAVIK